MEIIKFKSPNYITINPMYVRCVQIVKVGVSAQLHITLDNGNIHVTELASPEKVMETYEYVNRCIESINNINYEKVF